MIPEQKRTYRGRSRPTGNDMSAKLRAALMQEPRLLVLLTFLIVCALGGGVARWDEWPLIYVRSLAVIVMSLLIILPGTWNWKGLKVPLVLLTLFAATIAIQLVPLPPSIWTLLPGREPYMQAAAIADVPQPWRPISLIPIRTANSLLATLPAFVGLVAMAGISRLRWQVLADALLVVCCVSALLGTVQFGTGALYPYSPSDIGMPIGLLANRNHQALLLTIGIVLAAQWGMRRKEGRIAPATRASIALALVLLFTTVVLLTGSRTGLLLMLVAVGIVTVVAALRIQRATQRSPLYFLLVLAPFAMIALGAYAAQSSGVVRLNNSINQIDGDMRLLALPTTWQMALHYFPVGTGFGTFDRMFMQFEPEFLVKQTFFNRAHNDPVEIMITGGLPSLVVLAAFLCWFVSRLVDVFFRLGRSQRRSDGSSLARAATLSIAFALLASVVDYPLRTPLLSLIFVLLCGLSYRTPTTSASV